MADLTDRADVAGTASKTVSEQLADFIVGLRCDALPDRVTRRFELYCLDTLVVGLAGVSSESSRMIAEVVEELGGKQECMIFGRAARTNVVLSGLANSAATHAVELDDDHRTSVLHPGVVVVPAALAMAEHCGASGERFLGGIIAGYEIMTRLGDAFLGQQYYQGFHSTGTCGVFGAAAAAAHIAGLDMEQTVRALGIAGTQAAGLGEWSNDGSWIKRLHPGKAAEAGLLSVLLAMKGFTSPATIIEGEQGFLQAFSHKRRWDIGKILDGLGSELRGLGTSFKPYAGCRFSHQAVDAVSAIVSEANIAPAEVDQVLVRIHTTSYNKLFLPAEKRYHPRTPVDAQFSIPYITAIFMLHGRPMPQHFSEEMIRSPEVLELAGRVIGTSDDEYERQYPERYPTQVTIRLKNGEERSAYRDIPSGDPENEIYQADPDLFERHVLAKVDAMFETLPRFADRRDPLFEATMGIASRQSVEPLARLMRS